MRFNPLSVIAGLAVALLLMVATAPRQAEMSAQEVQQKQKQLDDVQAKFEKIADALVKQAEINEHWVNVDKSTRMMIDDLADAINHVGENMVDKSSVAKLVTTTLADEQAKTADNGDGCTCGEKLADLQRQIDELKAKLASVECNCNAYATSSYGTTASAAPVKSGGSTGTMMKATSGGSTGTVSYSQPVYSQPVVSSVAYSEPVIVASSITETLSDGCYIDENGVKRCPQQQPQAATTKGPIRSLFRRR